MSLELMTPVVWVIGICCTLSIDQSIEYSVFRSGRGPAIAMTKREFCVDTLECECLCSGIEYQGTLLCVLLRAFVGRLVSICSTHEIDVAFTACKARLDYR